MFQYKVNNFEKRSQLLLILLQFVAYIMIEGNAKFQ